MPRYIQVPTHPLHAGFGRSKFLQMLEFRGPESAPGDHELILLSSFYQ